MIPGLDAVGAASPAAVLGALVMGVGGGLLAGLAPGVSGRVGLLLVMPVALGLGPVAGAVFLVAFHSVVHTSGSIPAVLLGAPTSAAEAATVIDGHAMARRGEGARAIGATLAASGSGGVFGALVLLLLAPLALQAARLVGAPEIAALSLVGLLCISALSGGRLAAGLMAAALGVVIASIGSDPFSGAARFSFGRLELTDGVNAAALVTGLFVAPELTGRSGAASADGLAQSGTTLRAVLGGFRAAFGERLILLRSAIIGAAVGMAPGLGASVAVWLAYGHARQTHPSNVPYGQGALAGVIAPEAANNAKEGGALVPTLFFGVPSSSGMGILLAIFMVMGIEVGPLLLRRDPGFVYLMGWTNIAANLLAVPVCLVCAPLMARLCRVRRDQIAPFALAASAVATLLTAPGVATLAMIGAFSALGVLLKAAGVPRAPLLLAFVLAPGLESAALRAAMIYGWSALQRPGVIVILAGAAVIAGLSLRRRNADFSAIDPAMGRAVSLAAAGLTAVALAAAVAMALPLPATGSALPLGACAVGLAACGLFAWRSWRPAGEPVPGQGPDWRLLGLFFASLALAALAGAPPAAGALVLCALIWRGGVAWPKAALAGAATTLAAFAMGGLSR